ncbi:hypothetical protein [Hydrotalea sp.]|uniref:hypothetical protein n=1 Tax=Hydrotalea sp. TaxID=2881279 RepID=UPI002630CF9F|nr:hypothetical protein [Hydrotalea sp.]
MKNILVYALIAIVIWGCHKSNTLQAGCDIQKVYALNAQKVTITNGIWGTVSSMEGNCMPMVPPATNSCTNCPVQRTIHIYPYTLITNATLINNLSSFFESFNAPLIAEAVADEDGFYQLNLQAGTYSVAIVENGKLYANGLDGQGGLSPITLVNGVQKLNLIMTYKAVF